MLPVQHKTERFWPRAIAVIVTVSSCFILFFGTNAIARIERENVSFFEQDIPNGHSIWKISTEQDPTCLGYMKSALNVDDLSNNEHRALLLFEAQVRFEMGTQIIPAQVQFSASFDQFFELDRFNSSVKAEKGTVSVEMQDKYYPLSAEIELGKYKRSAKFSPPSRVYLVKTGQDMYRLRFPKNMANTLNRSITSQAEQKLVFTEIEADKINDCANSQSNDKTNKAGVKIGAGQQLFNLGK